MTPEELETELKVKYKLGYIMGGGDSERETYNRILFILGADHRESIPTDELIRFITKLRDGK